MHKFYTLLYFVILVSGKLNSQNLKIKLTEHVKNVEAVCYSPDGKYFASAGWDGLVNLYSIDSMGNPKLQQTFDDHIGGVNSLSFSSNSKYLVSGGKDFSAHIFNIDTPELSRTFNVHFNPVTKAEIDSRGLFLYTSSTDGTIKITNINDKNKSRTIKIGKSINDFIFTNDKRFIYVATAGGVLLKVGAIKGEVVSEIQAHMDDINALDLSPDGKTIITGSSDKTIKSWDVQSGKEIKTYEGFEWKVTTVEYTRDGKYIAGGCNNGNIRIFNAETAQLYLNINEMGNNVKNIAFSTDAKTLAAATSLEVEKYGAVLFNTNIVLEMPVRSKGTPQKDGSKSKTAIKKK